MGAASAAIALRLQASLLLGEGLERIKRRLDAELDETVALHDSYVAKVDKEVVTVLRERGRTGDAGLK